MNKLVIPNINTQFMIPMIMLTINETRCIAISTWCSEWPRIEFSCVHHSEYIADLKKKRQFWSKT